MFCLHHWNSSHICIMYRLKFDKDFILIWLKTHELLNSYLFEQVTVIRNDVIIRKSYLPPSSPLSQTYWLRFKDIIFDLSQKTRSSVNPHIKLCRLVYVHVFEDLLYSCIHTPLHESKAWVTSPLFVQLLSWVFCFRQSCEYWHNLHNMGLYFPYISLLSVFLGSYKDSEQQSEKERKTGEKCIYSSILEEIIQRHRLLLFSSASLLSLVALTMVLRITALGARKQYYNKQWNSLQ